MLLTRYPGWWRYWGEDQASWGEALQRFNVRWEPLDGYSPECVPGRLYPKQAGRTGSKMKILMVGHYWSDPTQGSLMVYDKVASALRWRGHPIAVWREQIDLFIALCDVAAWQLLAADAKWAANLGAAAREASKSWTGKKQRSERNYFISISRGKNALNFPSL